VKRPIISLIVVSLLSVTAAAEVRWIHASRAEKATVSNEQIAVQRILSEEKWVGTRAIVVDAATGTARRPTAVETATLVESLRKLTAAAEQPLNVVSNATGGEMAEIEGGYPNIVLVRPTADGGSETLCVHTFEEAIEFLGLVDETPSLPRERK
jgi:hypothetical protein